MSRLVCDKKLVVVEIVRAIAQNRERKFWKKGVVLFEKQHERIARTKFSRNEVVEQMQQDHIYYGRTEHGNNCS